MSLYFKEQANILSKTFNREKTKANEGLQILEELVRRFHQNIDKGTNSQEILEIMKKLSTLCAFLEMTNTGIDSIIGSADQKTFSQLSNSRPADLVVSRVKDWIRSDLSTYRAGDKIKISILNVVSSEKKLCFVQDIAKNRHIEFGDCVIGQCKLPPVGVVFAVNMNAKWLRAIRVDTEPTNTNIRVKLIDRGETLSISSNSSFFSLNSEAQNMPPKGFMCHIEKINGNETSSLDSISRWATYDVNINTICANMLEVDMWSVNDDKNVKIINDLIVECANGASKLNLTSESNGKSQLSVSPQLSGISQQNGTSELNGSSKINKEKHPKNPFLDDDDEVESFVSGSTLNSIPPTAKAPVCLLPPLPPRKFVTNEPLKIPVRIIQTKRTSVSEIETTVKEPRESDDNIINGKIESCVTGNNCETGAHPKWTDTYRENQERLRDHFYFEPLGMQELKLPSIGDMINVCPRHFQSFDEVFIHISPTDKGFDDLYNCIAEQQEHLKPLNYVPRVNDYVLARYSKDDSIYRAKVTQIVDAKTVMVNYIDYGNTESVSIDNNLFEWEKMCDTIPAQAVCCRIANMRRVCKVPPEKSFEYLANKYADQLCKAEILEKNNDSLIINLMNSMGIDICDEIIEYYQLNGLPETIV